MFLDTMAAAHRAGCRHLPTEDLHDGAEFDGVRVADPFRAPVGSIE